MKDKERRSHARHRFERWVVDGIEDAPRGPVARLEREDGRTFDLPLSALPDGVREGDVLALEDGPDGVTARVLPRETWARRKAAQHELDRLNAGDAHTGEGEITL
ncbi:DUF3006 domain-containing protein [Deinococcus sp. YIM 134068]|uniref:DUF3006 domain-containing protein n=1 Tax=Deinococcus lichenicola TaxID=3118910 RepID=UPI002F95E24F